MSVYAPPQPVMPRRRIKQRKMIDEPILLVSGIIILGSMMASQNQPQHAQMLTIATLGVVYGDIGTSPLYTLKECFALEHGVVNMDSVLGFLSLIFWALIFCVSLKYVTFVLRADHDNEGGIMVLMQEAKRSLSGKKAWYVMVLGLIGAALFYGDAVITPAISVLSAAEGLSLIHPGFEHYIIPFAVIIMIALFSVQRLGTQKVGSFFGPIMLLWFITLATLGIWSIIKTPVVLRAINPYYAIYFISTQGFGIFLGLGAIVLALTGAEALYADMGHFGRSPIRKAWFMLVLPSLVLNYFGQGALLLRDPSAIANPFYLLANNYLLIPMILLATTATVIASQAVISGAYSLTHQAIQMNFIPRMRTIYTSTGQRGQIYIPVINWLLLVIIILIIILFKDSGKLASAYGIAVTGTMVITSLLLYLVMIRLWHWPVLLARGLTALFLIFDLIFFSANLMKFFSGGWLPILLAIVIMGVFFTWWQGQQWVNKAKHKDQLSLQALFDQITSQHYPVIQGTAVYFNRDPQVAPLVFIHNLKHNKVLHERIIFLTFQTQDIPFVKHKERLLIDQLEHNIIRIQAQYGFKETPNVKQVMRLCERDHSLVIDTGETSFFLGREHLILCKSKRMARWRTYLFAWLHRNNFYRGEYYNIPIERSIELGTQIDL